MFAILKRWFRDPESLSGYQAEIRRGKRGRWRWYLRAENGRLVAESALHGEDTAARAQQALQRLLESEIRIARWDIEDPA